MGKGNHATGPFIATDIASIAAATTTTSFTAVEVPVWDIETIALMAFVTGGHASASGAVDFNFVGSVDGVTWGTNIVKTVTVTMSGAAKIVKTDQLDMTGYHSLKLYSIQNKDANYTATLVNVWWGKNYWF